MATTVLKEAIHNREVTNRARGHRSSNIMALLSRGCTINKARLGDTTKIEVEVVVLQVESVRAFSARWRAVVASTPYSKN